MRGGSRGGGVAAYRASEGGEFLSWIVEDSGAVLALVSPGGRSAFPAVSQYKSISQEEIAVPTV